MDARAIGVFDSGTGGLTVLHECLVTMPHEDFVYLGDHARLPYGPRSLAEVRGFALEIGRYLERQDVKLVLVACNTATSAGLPQLQEALSVPVVGVIQPEAHAAVQATRNRKIGLLATKVGEEAIEGYHIYVGGSYGAQQGIGREVMRNVVADDAPSVIERMIRLYLVERSSAAESFVDFARKIPTEELNRLIAVEGVTS